MQTSFIAPRIFNGPLELRIEMSADDMRALLREYENPDTYGLRRSALNRQIHTVIGKASEFPGFTILSEISEFSPTSDELPSTTSTPSIRSAATDYRTPEEVVAALQRMATDFHCDLQEVTAHFNRLAPNYTDNQREQHLRTTRLALRYALEAKQTSDREEADASALLLRCHDQFDKPLRDHQIRNAMLLAKETARITGLPLDTAVRRAITLRGFTLQPEPSTRIVWPGEAPIFGNGPVRCYEFTNHGNTFGPLPAVSNHERESHPIPEDRDLTDEELDAMLVELAAGVPSTLDEIREFVDAMKKSDAPCYAVDNRGHLAEATRVFTEPKQALGLHAPGDLFVQLREVFYARRFSPAAAAACRRSLLALLEEHTTTPA